MRRAPLTLLAPPGPKGDETEQRLERGRQPIANFVIGMPSRSTWREWGRTLWTEGKETVLMTATTKDQTMKTTPLREQRDRWRSELSEVHYVLEELSPRLLASAHERSVDGVPQEWKNLVQRMQNEVHAKAAESRDGTLEERRGYAWSTCVGRVGDMVEYLFRAIRDDIGMEGTQTIASMMLATRALLYVDLELQDGGSEEGREDSEENRYRTTEALKVLVRRFDDVHLRRLRALQVAETAARTTSIPTQQEIDRAVRALDELDDVDIDKHRAFLADTQPALMGAMARHWLGEIDSAFLSLDPLVVLEEFAEAASDGRGGKAERGEGRVGPVRALARLAVMSGALGCSQNEGEGFDAAVDRARNALLMSRSRIRKAIRAFGSEEAPER